MKTGLESSADADQLRALDILAEDPGQFPAHTWWNSTTPTAPFPWGTDTLYGLLGYCVHKTLKHEKSINLKKKKQNIYKYSLKITLLMSELTFLKSCQ